MLTDGETLAAQIRKETKCEAEVIQLLLCQSQTACYLKGLHTYISVCTCVCTRSSTCEHLQRVRIHLVQFSSPLSAFFSVAQRQIPVSHGRLWPASLEMKAEGKLPV